MERGSDQIRIEVRSIEKWLGEKIFGLLIKFKLLWRQTDVNRHVKVFVKVLQFSQFLKKDSLWCWCSKSKGHGFTIYWSLFWYFYFFGSVMINQFAYRWSRIAKIVGWLMIALLNLANYMHLCLLSWKHWQMNKSCFGMSTKWKVYIQFNDFFTTLHCICTLKHKNDLAKT